MYKCKNCEKTFDKVNKSNCCPFCGSGNYTSGCIDDNEQKVGELKIRGEQGKCAKCNSSFLNYGISKLEDESIGYRYRCENCGHIGIGWFRMKYSEST